MLEVAATGRQYRFVHVDVFTDRVHLTLELSAGRIQKLSVGGGLVPVLEGELTLG